jgi:hypothetical protein
LDVDIRYVRSDGIEGALNIAQPDAPYSAEATRTLIDYAIRSGCVDFTYYDMDNAGFCYPGITFHQSGHSDHVHLRIVDPDGSDN